ncbi:MULTISPECIES: SGNH/GDSL hydrolase family protein [unclassified Streptomyces]|uniref:SGNH/GDSL hydrolase family protein n=1 Tax=unclassified Streptomyces TaxID=2593676 RepID=UPI0006FCC609|nr:MULTISPECIES: SGNH/GDSL hydrolase family protein [unclassified Streptomyces]KQX49420.1 hypothetical protein ASD33_16885 [Streptomyces sp. Root1304]KRA79038.1 hypothetical protein ASE09_21405 [Streptomyces sp. Root66D1]
MTESRTHDKSRDGAERTTAPDHALTAKLLRFQQPEKTLRYLGELSDSRLADLFGLELDTYRAVLRDMDDQARNTAAELLEDPAFAERVDALPFRPGQRIVALGESTTADRLSWCAILRHLLPDGVVFVDLAVSGLTTTQALAQLPPPPHLRPDWVLCMLGANDTRRIGRGADAPGTRLVSGPETERNLLALRELAAPVPAASPSPSPSPETSPETALHGADRWIWLTPSSVDQERADAYPHFRHAGTGWSAEDVDGVADFLLGRPELTVDTRPATVGLHLDDGIHLTLEGQRAVTVALVEALTPKATETTGTAGAAGTAVTAEATAS